MHPSTILRQFLLAFLLGLFGSTTHAADVVAPFELAVVPSYSTVQGQGIAMGDSKSNVFHVVLTNVSKTAQPVFETWNSWGYQALSFEFTTADGKKFYVLRREEDFTKNFPSTFLIQPGEHQVYPIRLDQGWEGLPDLAENGKIPIHCTAIYHVAPTPEAAEYHVWAGRIESKAYDLALTAVNNPPSPSPRSAPRKQSYSP